MKKNIFFGAIIVVIGILSGCKSLSEPIDPKFNSLPLTYSNLSQDTLNSADLKPKQLFNDSLLNCLIDSALAKNLSLLKSRTSIMQLEADLQEARSNLIPKVGTFAGYSKRKFGLHTMDGAGNITTNIGGGEIIPIHLNDFNFGLQTSWEIDVWGKLKQQKKASQARYLASLESQNMLKTWVVEQVVLNYFNLVVLDETKRIIERNISLNQEMVEVLRAQKEAGKTTEMSVKQFEALILNYANELLKIEQEINFRENDLRILTSNFEGKINRSHYDPTGLLNIKINVGLPAQILQNRPDVRQSEQELIATKADLIAARKMFYPSLSINGSIGYQAYRTRFLFASPESIAYGLFGNITAPLVNMGALKANFKRASSSQLNALYECQETLLNAFTEVNNGLYAIGITDKMIQNKSDEVQKLINARIIASEMFNSNRAQYFEVLISQQNSISAELELMDLTKSLFVWKVFLYKSLGGGWK
jgi:NodT family efflux transporter outer membrane factor (OMF) lipoprotein